MSGDVVFNAKTQGTQRKRREEPGTKILAGLAVRPRTVFLALAAAIVGYQILVPPVVGLGNSGDFGKVIGVFALAGHVEDENAWAQTRYEFNPEKRYWAEFYSSEHVVMALAVAANTVLGKDGYFDVRAIGLIHGALLLVALFLLWTLLEDSPRVLRIATCGAVLLCFTDVMYVSYLNSFYMDVAAWLFLSIAAMLYLRLLRSRRWTDVVWFGVCSALAITSKAQHGILGFWLAGLLLAAGFALWPKQRRWTIAAAAGLILLAGVWIAKSSPPDYASRGVFTMAFYRILPHAKNADQTIRDLGLDESYLRYTGMHSFAEGSPMEDRAFVERFRHRISYGSLIWFYLTHPRDTYTALRHSLNEAGAQRPNLGNFDRQTGYPPFHTSRAFAFWSGLKKRAFDRQGSRYLFTFLFLAAAVGALLAAQRVSLHWPDVLGGGVLIGTAFTALCVASLADAVDVSRHHLLFYVLFDMLVVLLVHLSVRAWLTRARG
jgi:hypothetical protein